MCHRQSDSLLSDKLYTPYQTNHAGLTYQEIQNRPSQLCGKRNHRLIAKIAIVWLPVASIWRSMSPLGAV